MHSHFEDWKHIAPAWLETLKPRRPAVGRPHFYLQRTAFDWSARWLLGKESSYPDAPRVLIRWSLFGRRQSRTRPGQGPPPEPARPCSNAAASPAPAQGPGGAHE